MARPASTFDTDEPVERLPGDFHRSKTGTPYVSDPTGATRKPKNKKDTNPPVKRLAYGRPSSFGKQIEDTYNLQKWSERTVALGIAVDPELIELAAKLVGRDRDTEEWKADADLVVIRAKEAAKAGLAAERGSHTHELTEDDDEERDWIARAEKGEILGLDRDVQASLVQAWRDMLERDGLEILATEAAVVHDGYRKAGKLDRIARLTKPLRFTLHTGEIVELEAGRIPVLDIKTGKRRRDPHGVVMYWQSYAVQIATYAGAVPYDTETDTRGAWPFEIDQQYALIAHLDVLGALDGNPSCELVLVDLEAGREAAELCLAAKTWEKRPDVFSVAQIVDAPGIVGELAAHIQHLLDDGTLNVAHLEDVLRALKFPDPATPAVAEQVAEEGEDSAPAPSSAEPAPAPAPELTPAEQIALVPTDPDEGEDADAAAVAALQRAYAAVPKPANEWIGRLASQATQALVPFGMKDRKTVRRFEILRGLVALVNDDGATDDTLRGILELVIGDIVTLPAVTLGHALGSLDAERAAEFAQLACGAQISQHTAA